MDQLAEVIAERPDYDGGSIVNLMSSIIGACGGESGYPALDTLDPGTLRSSRHVILIVIDGLGYEFLRGCPSAPVLNRFVSRSLTSVFPPTTATAVTTFLTGLAPQQHGLTGWFMYFREIGSVVRVLPFNTRFGATPLVSMGVSVESLLGHVPVFDHLGRTCFSVSPARIAHSAFNLAHAKGAGIRPYHSLEEFFLTIETLVKGALERSFVYAYWPELDHLGHLHGMASQPVRDHLGELDSAFDGFLRAIDGTDSMVLVTADHGFVDIESERVVSLDDHPELRESLLVPLCGEPRTAYCYVSPRRTREFVRYVERELSDRAVCVPSEELVQAGYFGPGSAHPRLADRVGEFTLLMRDGYAIQDALPGEERFRPIGMHGGGSLAELRVPLLIAEA